MTTHSTGPRIGGLDGLRAIAVLMVFVHHRISTTWELGQLGVDVFFVISGYLIVGILHEQRRTIEAGSSFRQQWTRFWRRRAWRLFPVYYLTLALIGVAIALGLTSVAGFPSDWLFLNNFYMYWQGMAGNEIHWADAFTSLHFWTLAVEQQFYLLVSVLLLALDSRRHALAMRVLIAISIASFAAQALFDPANNLNSLLPAQNLVFLASGALLRLVGPPKRSLLWLGASAAFIVMVAFHRQHGQAPIDHYARPFLDLVVAFCVVAHVLRFQDGRLVRWLSLKPLVFLGTISYGFYVFHLLPPEAWQLDLHLASRWARGLWFSGQLLVTLALATASWRWIEQPLLRAASKGARQAPAGRGAST